MRVLLDACVMVPATTRGLLLGAARQGWFVPLWSARILEEWGHAAARHGRAAEARVSQALIRDRFPEALIDLPPRDDLWLPDPDDIHVLAAAIAGRADELLTANTGDFPQRILGGHGLIRRHPDEFLLELARLHEQEMAGLVSEVLQSLPGDLRPRKALQKSGLNRFAKFIAQDAAIRGRSPDAAPSGPQSG